MGQFNQRRNSDTALLTIQTMLRQGMDPVLVAFILQQHDLNPGLIHFLTGPIILHQPLARNELPDWLPKAVYMDRLEKIIHEHTANTLGETATLADAVAYLFAAAARRSGEVAWQPEWVRIYGHISYLTLTKYDFVLPAAEARGMEEFKRTRLTRRERDELLCPFLQCLRQRIATKSRLAMFSTVNDTVESYAEHRSSPYPSFRQLAQGLKGEMMGRPDIFVEQVMSLPLQSRSEI